MKKYSKIKVIGEGNYGKVYLVKRNLDGKCFARKQLDI